MTARPIADFIPATITFITLAGCAFITLAGCAFAPFQQTTFAPADEIQSAVSRYYEAHAVEDDQRCWRPYFDTVTKVSVLDEQADRLVLDVRYAYRDRLRDDQDSSNPILPGSRRVCWGFESRRFTLAKSEGRLRVIEMSGDMRGQATSDRPKEDTGGVTSGAGMRVTLGG